MSSESPIGPRIRLADALRAQATACGRDGSPLYAYLLGRAAADVADGGPCWEALGAAAVGRLRENPALQLMGAAQRLALSGEADALAQFYPSAGGAAPTDAAGLGRVWLAFRALVADRVVTVRALACRPVQTNEVGRSAALVGGFLTVARETDLPLRLLELGASAGLNLRWDAYRYEAGGLAPGDSAAGRRAWGDPSSLLRFVGVYREGCPPLEARAWVAARAGCDRAPLDAALEADRMTLRSYVWADQTARIERLRAALALAATLPVTIEQANAPEWLERQVAHPMPGLGTVIFHSIFIGYLPKADRARLVSAIRDAGQRATRAAPLAWLRMEADVAAEADARDATGAAIWLTLWPGGEERLLARAGFHGQHVRWYG